VEENLTLQIKVLIIVKEILKHLISLELLNKIKILKIAVLCVVTWMKIKMKLLMMINITNLKISKTVKILERLYIVFTLHFVVCLLTINY
jgi:hypothetical protein